MFRLNVVLHFGLGDRLIAVATHFEVSATVDFVNGEIRNGNILFATRRITEVRFQKKKKNTDNNVKLFFKKLSYICFFIGFRSL